MPQQIKYVGPKDTKTFQGFVFERDVATVATKALEVPDAVANAALKHPTVFMQWNKPVPAEVLALRDQYPDALQKEGEDHYEHFAACFYAAKQIDDTSPAGKLLKEKEIAGAKAEMEHGKALIAQAHALRANVPDAPAEVFDAFPDSASLLERMAMLETELATFRAAQAKGEAGEGRIADLHARMSESLTVEPETLETLGLTPAVLAALKAEGVETVVALAALTREKLGAVKGIGQAAVTAVAGALEAKGLALATDPA